MTRIAVICGLSAVVLSAAIAASAQGTAYYSPPIGSSIVSSFPFLGTLPEIDLKRMSLSSHAVFGWKHFSMNYSLDSAYQSFGALQESPLVLVVPQTDVWTGRVDAALKLTRRMRLFGILEGNSRGDLAVSTPVEPANADTGEPAVWKGSRLEWWTLDGGMTIDMGRDWRMVAGLKHDHLQMELRDPVNLAAPGDFAGDDYSASFRSKMWIPYMGVELVGTSYTVALVASSLASLSFQVPFRYKQAAADDEEAYYSFSAGGYFLEGTLQYVMLGNATITSGIWAKASLMRFRGSGQEGLVDSSGTPLPRTISGFSVYSRYEYAIGLAASLNF